MHELLTQWLEMCCTTPEFIANYNRLYGAKVDFTPKVRAPIEAMVDKACGHEFGVVIPDTEDNKTFMCHCCELFVHMNGPLVPAKVEG